MKSLRPFVVGIAGRNKSNYAQFSATDAQQTVRMCKEKRNISRQRYSAINMMGGHAHEIGAAPPECKTVEVRVFKGSLEPFDFIKNIEFLMSTYEFTSCHAMKDILVKKYLDYILLKSGNWRALLQYIKFNKDINKSYSYISDMLKGI